MCWTGRAVQSGSLSARPRASCAEPRSPLPSISTTTSGECIASQILASDINGAMIFNHRANCWTVKLLKLVQLLAFSLKGSSCFCVGSLRRVGIYFWMPEILVFDDIMYNLQDWTIFARFLLDSPSRDALLLAKNTAVWKIKENQYGHFWIGSRADLCEWGM